MHIRQILLMSLVSLVGIEGAFMATVRAAAFTCPDTGSAAMQGTAPPPADLYSGADDATASKRLGELMADFRKSGTKPALIVDHLVGAYCPLVAADTTLSDKQKADRVRRFAQLVTGLAYVPRDPDEVDVLVQTAVPPALLGQ